MVRKIIVPIGVCLLCSLVGLILIVVDESTEWGYIIFDKGLSMAQLFGLVVVVRSGTIIETVYFRVIVAFVAIILFGALLKILHYNYADQSFLFGFLGIAATYLVRFFAKKEKGHLDVLKLLWVLSASLGAILIMLHLVPREFKYLIMGTFWLLLLDFIWLEFRTRSSN